MNNEYDIDEAFEKIENEIISSMKRNLSLHLKEEELENMNWNMWQVEQLKSLEQFKKNNSKKFKKTFEKINKEIEKLIRKSYDDGRLSQEKETLEAIKTSRLNTSNKQINKLLDNYNTTNNERIKKKQLTKITNLTSKTEASFFKVNERKLNALIEETVDNVKEVETSILRYANDEYRRIIFDAQVYANTGAGTVKQAVDTATKDFLSAGINSIEYKDGRRVNIKSYVTMAIRTANTRAKLEGEGSKKKEWGIHTVLFPNRGGGCPFCVKYQGKVFIDDVWSGGTKKESEETGYPLISMAIKNGAMHPNCKDTLITYYPGITTKPTPQTQKQIKEKEEEYKRDQKLSYIDRNIEKYKRLELGSIDEENAEKYHNKRLDWEKFKEKFKENKDASFGDIIEENKKKQKELIKSKIAGNILNETEIKEISDHLIDQLENRKVTVDDLLDTLKNPLECGKIKYDKDNRPSFKVVGKKSTFYVNSDTGVITTIHKTHTKTIEKLKKRKEKE